MRETEIPDAGMERLHADVMAVPSDQRALGLVEKILDDARFGLEAGSPGLRFRLGLIQGNAERLGELLERQANDLKTWKDVFEGYFGPEGRDIAIADKAVQDLFAELRMAQDDKAELLEALGAVVRDENPSGHALRCREFGRNTFTLAQDCCGPRIARAVITKGGKA